MTEMDARIDDLEALVELGQEEADADTLEEAERELRRSSGPSVSSRCAPCSAVSTTPGRPS